MPATSPTPNEQPIVEVVMRMWSEHSSRFIGPRHRAPLLIPKMVIERLSVDPALAR